MRKVTQQSVTAFLNHQSGSFGNTTVIVNHESTVMSLHGNIIARHFPVSGKIRATLAGWNTPTTRDRINGIAHMCNGAGVYQKKFLAYTSNDKQISDTEWFIVKEGK